MLLLKPQEPGSSARYSTASARMGSPACLFVQESHLAVHTWPGRRYAAIDLFTCGSDIDPWLANKSLKRAFGAKRDNAVEVGRGLIDEVSAED